MSRGWVGARFLFFGGRWTYERGIIVIIRVLAARGGGAAGERINVVVTIFTGRVIGRFLVSTHFVQTFVTFGVFADLRGGFTGPVLIGKVGGGGQRLSASRRVRWPGSVI